MERRPISDQVRQWLTEELEVWRSGGILNADQPGQILNLYETAADSTSRRRSLAVFVLSGIASLLIGLAALLVVSYNWNGMAALHKVAVLLGSLLGLHAVALTLRSVGQPSSLKWRRLISELVFFVACILYGAGIWLIAQIFNIQSHYPDGLWFWALGVLPFVLCLDTALLHVLYAALLAIWVGTEILGFQGVDPWWFRTFYFPRSAWTLPLMVAPGLVWAYRKQSVVAVGLYAPLLAWWAILQPVAWQWHVDPVYFVGLAGVLLLLAAELHREDSPMAKPYRVCGVLVIGGALLPMSFADFMIHLVHYSLPWQNVMAGLVISLIGAVAALLVVVFQQRGQTPDRASWAELLRRQWLPLTMLLLLAGLCFWSATFTQCDSATRPYWDPCYYGHKAMLKWTPQILVPVAATNAAMVVLALWLMRLGIREDSVKPFIAGVLYFLLWTVLRYIDLFADVGGMLGAALLFLLCGVGLLAVARFWIHRKEGENARL